MFDYNKLKTFETVADAQSISRAAKKLHRTQSAISQQIALLEEDLEIKLFERRHGRIFLTKEGSHLRENASTHFAAIDKVILETQGKLQSLTGKISIGISSTHAKYLLIPQIKRIQNKFPNLQIDLFLGTDLEIEYRLEKGLIDFGIITLFKTRALFQTHAIYRYEEHPFGSKEYLSQFGKKGRFTLKDLLRFELIDFSSEFLCFGHWLSKNAKALNKRLQESQPKYIAQDHEVIKSLVTSNLGIAILPTFIVSGLEKEGSVKRVFARSKPTVVDVDIAYRRKKQFPEYTL